MIFQNAVKLCESASASKWRKYWTKNRRFIKRNRTIFWENYGSFTILKGEFVGAKCLVWWPPQYVPVHVVVSAWQRAACSLPPPVKSHHTDHQRHLTPHNHLLVSLIIDNRQLISSNMIQCWQNILFQDQLQACPLHQWKRDRLVLALLACHSSGWLGKGKRFLQTQYT